jgi:hypothetical protein
MYTLHIDMEWREVVLKAGVYRDTGLRQARSTTVSMGRRSLADNERRCR